jgi:purine-nucleoside phosphorylase
MQQVTYPVRVMKLLGMQKLLMSNISGGLNPGYELGDMVGVEDHINLHYENPLAGPNLSALGPRWPNMNEAYDRRMLTRAEEFCREKGYSFKRGVYVSLPGPNLETPAEYRYLRLIGADCVGMSTVPEVIVARHMAMPTFVLSIITDLAYGEIKAVTVEELLAVAETAQPKMTAIFKYLISPEIRVNKKNSSFTILTE